MAPVLGGLKDMGGGGCFSYPYLGVSWNWGIPRLAPVFGGVEELGGS